MKILMIVDPERKDFYDYLKQDTANDYLLLWHESRSDIPAWISQEAFFKNYFSWEDFFTPMQLIDEVNPDRIVFFEIIDQRQIALLVAANKKIVKTFYLEHGAAGSKETAIERANVKNYFFNRKLYQLIKRFSGSSVKIVLGEQTA